MPRIQVNSQELLEHRTNSTPILMMEPEGLKQYPIKPVEIPLQKVKEESNVPISVNVGWFDLIKLWIKENLINDILNSKSPNTGVYMSKAWYLSKTLWVNALTLIWQFAGPGLGLPVLDATLMVTLLGIINFILRLITKSEVTVS